MRLHPNKIAVILLIAITWEVTSVKLSSTSIQHQRLHPYSVANVYCNADGVIDKCQFNICNLRGNVGQTEIDSTSLTNHWAIHRSFASYSYSLRMRSYDTNLTEGRCGISLMDLDNNAHYTAGCRVRGPRGAWVYSYSTLFVSVSKDYDVDLRIQPESPVFEPTGTEVDLTCRSSSGCNFVATTGIEHSQHSQRQVDATGVYCQAIKTLTDENSGMAWCDDARSRDARGTSVSTVSPPTHAPLLQLSGTSKPWHVVGEMLEVTCTVMESRPPANITWYLRDRIMDGDAIEEVTADRWRWSWEAEERTQIMRRNLTAEDDGKVVTCSASHFALKDPLHSAIVVQVVSETSTSATMPNVKQRIQNSTPVRRTTTVVPTTAATTRMTTEATSSVEQFTLVKDTTVLLGSSTPSTTPSTTTTTTTATTPSTTTQTPSTKDKSSTTTILKTGASSSTSSSTAEEVSDKASDRKVTVLAVVEGVIIAALLLVIMAMAVYLMRLTGSCWFAALPPRSEEAEAWDLASIRDYDDGEKM